MPSTNPLRPDAATAFAAWDALVRTNVEQMERLREAVRAADEDFWTGRTAAFRPGVRESPELAAIEALARPGDTWLDIGAGGGRFAVPLSTRVARVVAIEPSGAMRDTLTEAARQPDAGSIDVIDLRWPPAADDTTVPVGDVAFAANVLYDIADLRAFLDAMERHARRTCIALVTDRAPSTPHPQVWEALYGEPLCALPALPELLAILGALSRRFDVETFPVRPSTPMTPDEAVDEMRWRYWVAPGSERAARLSALLVEHFGTPDGLVTLPPRFNYLAVVSWPSTGGASA